MKAKITAALVKAPPPMPAGSRKLRITDTEVTGFVMEVWPSGGITFWCKYTDPAGRSREIKIGKACDVSVEQARRKAKELRAQVALTGDPAGDKDKRRAIPTFKAFVTEQYLPFAKDRLRSYSDHESMCRLRLIPSWGNKRLDEVKTTDIVELQRRLRDEALSPSTVNRHVALAKRIFNLALRWQAYDGRNPCQHVELARERQRDRFLTQDEVRRLFQALDLEPNRSAASCIALMALTGCRKGEALSAQYADIDLANRVWTVPASRSKSGKVRRIPLSEAALTLLQGLSPKPDCPWLFPNEAGDGPIENIRRSWSRLKTAAELPPDTRPHDLRHTAASLMAQNGCSLHLIAAVLGHATTQMSSRYAHFGAGHLIEAADIVGRIATANG
jgi:integrase